MPSGTSVAFALVRVPRGEPRPSDEAFRTALEKDRERLHQPAPGAPTEVQIAGPYPVTVGEAELDEYVAWER
jgi:hypothetical protein